MSDRYWYGRKGDLQAIKYNDKDPKQLENSNANLQIEDYGLILDEQRRPWTARSADDRSAMRNFIAVRQSLCH